MVNGKRPWSPACQRFYHRRARTASANKSLAVVSSGRSLTEFELRGCEKFLDRVRLMHVLRSRRDVLENRLVHGRTYSTEYRGVGARGVVFSTVFCLSAVPLRTVLRRLGERHCSHQIMSKRVPQRHRFDLVKPTHQKLAEPASARNGVDTFGGRGALFVNLL